MAKKSKKTVRLSRSSLATMAALVDGGTGVSIGKKCGKHAVDFVFNSLSSCLAGRGVVAIDGFGTFTIRTRAARVARNPRTGESIDVAEKLIVRFKPASKLDAQLNPHLYVDKPAPADDAEVEGEEESEDDGEE